MLLAASHERNHLWTRTTAHLPSQPGPASEPFGTEMLVGDAEPALTTQDLFENRLDEVADAIDLARTAERAQPAVARVLPEPSSGRMRKTPWPTFPLVKGSFSMVAPTGFEPALPP